MCGIAGLSDMACAVCRAELVAHYTAVGRDAELRRLRAEWREARLRLASRRRQWLEEEGERWEREDGKGEGERWEREDGKGEGERWRREDGEGEQGRGQGEEERREETVGDIEDGPGGAEEEVIVHLPSPPLSPGPMPQSSPPPLSEATCVECTSPVLEEQLASGGEPSLPQPVPAAPHPGAQSTHGQPTIHDIIHCRESGPDRVGVVNGHRSTRGVPPPSTVQEILHPPPGLPVHHVQTSRGHAPQTTIQHLLYPLNSVDNCIPAPPTTQERCPAPPTTQERCSLSAPDSSVHAVHERQNAIHSTPHPYTLTYPHLGIYR